MMTNWDRIRRRFGEVAFKHLQKSTVAVIGCGSGGGHVALDLAESGIGNFILVDMGFVKEENIVRHVADSRYIGRPKVQAVGELIKFRNESASLKMIQKDIKECFKVVSSADILLVCVDEESVKHWINIQARELGKTAIYAGVYEKGEGGDVCIVYPEQGPCYACISSELRISDEGEGPKEKLDYGLIDEKGTLRGEPGLGIHVKRIATFQSDWAIRELLKGTESTLENFPTQVFIFYNESREVFVGKPKCKPGTGFWVQIPKNPNCLICSLDSSQAPAALDELLDEKK